MSRTYYDTADEAIAAYLADCERHCDAPYKVSERLDWADWLEANPPPSDKYVINWADTLSYNFSDDGWAVVWKPCWSEKWSYRYIDGIRPDYDFMETFNEHADAVLIQVDEDDDTGKS